MAEKILLIVKDEIFTTNLKLLLEHEQYEVEVINNILNLEENYTPNLYGVVFFETDMYPNDDGLKIVEKLAMIDAKTNFIIYSKRNALVDKFKAINVGAEDYIVKPETTENCMKRIIVNL